jgi:hypothetical protein
VEKINALIIFCEGPHDVAFCSLVFKNCFKIEIVKWKFSQYPYPFNQMFPKIMEDHAINTESLDMAHDFFLPDKTFYDKLNNLLILLFNTGGEKKTKKNPIKFLSRLLKFTILQDEGSFDSENKESSADKIIDDPKYLFLYDRDDKEPTNKFETCKKVFSLINNKIFISENFKINIKNSQGAHSMGKKFNVYVFSKPNCNGTLEDILIPIFEECKSEIMSKTTIFIDDCFTWDNSKISKKAKRNKAIICTAGQKEKPGASMNVIINQSNLISEEVFKKNQDVKLFADFINDIIIN